MPFSRGKTGFLSIKKNKKKQQQQKQKQKK